MTSGDVSSGADELSGQMRPLVPRWQLFAGFLGFLLLFPTAYPPALDANTVFFWVVLLTGLAALLAYVLRNKTVKVRIRPGERCLLITSEWEPNPGKLVPSRVQMKSDKVIEVERKGKRWEVKRIELQFTSQQDATKAIEMLKQTSSGSVLPGGVESRILQVRYSLGYAWMVTVLRLIIPTRSIMLSQDLKLTQCFHQGLRFNNKSGFSVCFQDEAPAQSYTTVNAESKKDNGPDDNTDNKLVRWMPKEQIREYEKA